MKLIFDFVLISGLLSAHVLAEYIRKNQRGKEGYLQNYRGELLEMAKGKFHHHSYVPFYFECKLKFSLQT